MTGARRDLVIVAGPNGSGKTTLVRSGALDGFLMLPVNAINADDVARDMAGGSSPTDAQSLLAAKLCDGMLDRNIARGVSTVIETVLSSGKLRPRVIAAREGGFQISLIFVTLRTAELNVRRVAQRVQLGGHPVPQDRIIDRRRNAHANFAWFAAHADLVLVFDNTNEPTLAAAKIEGAWLVPKLFLLPRELQTAITMAKADEFG